MRQETRFGSLRRRLGAAGGAAGLILGIVLLCVPACSTLTTVGSGETYLYSGTRANIGAINPNSPSQFGDLGRMIAFCDFPCSLVLDTVLIPITLPLQIIVGDRKKSSPSPEPNQESDEEEE